MSAAARSISLVRDDAPERPAGRSRTSGVGHVCDLSADQRAVLADLRMAALACRSAAKLDVLAICATLSVDRDVAAGEAAAALVRALPGALGLRPVLFRPGTMVLSFDEAWLLRLIDAERQARFDDVKFLLTSRVAPAMRRNLGILAAAVARTAGTGTDMSI